MKKLISPFRILKYILFCLAVVCIVIACRKSADIVGVTDEAGRPSLSIAEAKQYFDAHFNRDKNQKSSLVANATRQSNITTAIDSLLKNKQALWQYAYQQIMGTGGSVKVPLGFGSLYIVTNQSKNEGLPFGALNYLYMYKDTLLHIHAEWVTLLPDEAWLHGRRQTYTGKIMVRDWDTEQIIKMYSYGSTSITTAGLKTQDVATGIVTTEPICITWQIPDKCRAAHPGNPNNGDPAGCDMCTGCTETRCFWPPPQPPVCTTCDPTAPGTPPGTTPGGTSPATGPGVGGAGAPYQPTPPPNCNANPNYVMPTTPAPPGMAWIMPCGGAGGGIPVPTIPLSLILESDPQLDLDIETNDETIGGYDGTTYPDYQPNDSWPTISNVVSPTDFVPFNGTNCLALAKKQLLKAGYQISGYGDPGQTYNINTIQTGIDPITARKAVGYLIGALQAKIPVIVGVDYRPGVPLGINGAPANYDGMTDHFIVIVGMGTDNTGKFFNFFDSATSSFWDGTSSNNKLYYNETTGTLKGTTDVSFAAAQVNNIYMYRDSNNKVIYTVTHVRRSKVR